MKERPYQHLPPLERKPDGSPWRVAIRDPAGDGNIGVVEVADQGVGIPPEEAGRIFEPFYSHKNSNYNWGMGLYYVRAIVKSHLGLLRMESRPGEGSQFFVMLPRYEPK